MLDLAIIGGGPAGLSAGLYATRGGLKNVVMFEKGLPGGQITSSSEIENYPGSAEILSGLDFMAPWSEQCMRFGLKHAMEEVTRVSKNSDGTFQISLAGGKSEQAKSVIVCTGSTPKKANFEGEAEFFGKGVSTCATCDGFFYKNRELIFIWICLLYIKTHLKDKAFNFEFSKENVNSFFSFQIDSKYKYPSK